MQGTSKYGSRQNQPVCIQPDAARLRENEDRLDCQSDDELWGYLVKEAARHQHSSPKAHTAFGAMDAIPMAKRLEFAKTVSQAIRHSMSLEDAIFHGCNLFGPKPEEYSSGPESILCPNCKQCKYCQVRFDQAAAQHDCQSHKSSEGQHEWEKSGLSYYGYYLNIDCGYCNGSGLWTPLRPSGSEVLYIAGFSDAVLEGVKDFLYRGLEYECTAFYPHEQGYAAEFDGFWHSDEVQDIQQRLQYRFPAQMFTVTYHRGE